LTRCRLPLPTYVLADEKHSRCLAENVYLPNPRQNILYTSAEINRL
jgi:hypothetical protein